MPQDYNETLNLPRTEFPMRGNLPKREPEMLKEMQANGIYEKLMEKNEGKPSYILHDGPPYANGNIHLGTALNKVLKDIIIKEKNMTGYCAPYVPGWDTHGLPIELKTLKSLGENAGKLSPVELRARCREFALGYVQTQREQFERLGVIGDFSDPYLTLKKEFEAQQIEVFGAMAKRDFIYKGLKPVYWCSECGTALAEAEIEYADDPCDSIYVKFQVTDDKGYFTKLGVDPAKVYFVIWTTTTWTLPANLAICLGPKYRYTLVNANGEYYVVACELVAPTMEAAGITEYTTVGEFDGAELEYMKVAHPFMNRESLVIVGDHVTLESGTGCVHTAPGHGVEDFEVCKNYPEIPMVVPVDSEGKMTKDAGEFEGLTTAEANVAIAKHLKESGHLFALQKIVHQYPHCWRCNQPVLFRATEQWFCSVDSFKQEALDAIAGVQWIPEWGEGRISNMVRDRSDWCISRQRVWGVPIPIIYCKDCGKPIITDETITAIAAMFREKGSDSWYTEDPADFLPEGFACPDCGCREFTKEKDIMDVWFDSGVTHAAVLDQREGLHSPADLYLEGADQYRGWFQSSLLTSVAWKGQSPYKAVCTHGWVVDGEGRKMSKSLGNGIAPEDIIKKYGADILRLWVASSDYHADIRISPDILKQLSEGYRKIRNTARFLLSNLYDFDPNKDMLPNESLREVDKFLLDRFGEVAKKSREAYDAFDFHLVYHAIRNFCVVDLSNFYLDISKDRTYCDGTNSESRRAAQSTMYQILHGLTRLIAPILAFTSDEIWKAMPHLDSDDVTSVLFHQMPEAGEPLLTGSQTEKWETIMRVREEVNKALEEKRNEKIIGKPLDAAVTLCCEGSLSEFCTANAEDIRTACLVSALSVEAGNGAFASEMEGLSITVTHAEGEKCERCWTYSDTVGSNADHPHLCARCASAIQ